MAVWNRPTSVVLERADGGIERYPVRDLTRLIQVVCYSLALIMLILTWINRKRSETP